MEGRRGAARRRRRSRRGRSLRGRTLIAAALAVGAAFIGAVAVAGVVTASSYYDGLQKLDELEQPRLPVNTNIYARDGSRLSVIASAENRRLIPLRNMGTWLPAATVAIEDRRFYEHDGVDWKAVGRAAVKNLEAGRLAEGGSTLTQQLVRNIFPQITAEVSLKRKVNEAVVALELEKRYSKEWILEQYLNTVPYGQNSYGAEAAAETYFNKRTRDLTIAEAAMLAGLPQAPSRFNPFTNRSAARARRDEVLQAMRAEGMITAAEYAAAVAAVVDLERGELFGRAAEAYFVQYVRTTLENDEQFGAEAVLSGGLRVTTTIDRGKQALAYSAMRQVLSKPPCLFDPKPACGPAAALVSIRPATGEIVAMASTSTFRSTQFNFAQGQRQPGSTFKPFTLAAAIEAGIEPARVYYQSAPFQITKNDQWGRIYGEWKVRTGNYAGRISIERATVASDNTVFAQLILDVGPEQVKDVAERLGIVDSELEAVPSLTLGSKGVTPLEMTSAYATLAAGGVYRKPRAITQVGFAADRDRLIKYSSRGKRVISDGVAAEVTRILGLNMVGGTGRNARTTDQRPQAGKTGTTDDAADAWFCGYTPDLATCVWIGYPVSEQFPLRNIEGVSTVFGGTLPSDIWQIFMDGALRNVPASDFPEPKSPPKYIANFRSEFTERAVEVIPPAIKKEIENAKGRDGGAAGGGGAPGP